MVRTPLPTRLAVLFLGAVAAAIALSVQLSVLTLLDEIFGSSSSGVWIYVGLVALFFAVPCFVLGYLVLGYPVWSLMDRLGVTGYLSAAFASAIGSTLMGGALLLAGGQKWWVCSIALPLAGAVGGLVVRLFGYESRPPRPSPARPS